MIAFNPLQSFLNRRVPLLTHHQEIDLARRVAMARAASRQLKRANKLTPPQRRILRQRLREGEAARETLVLHNLPLVLSVARRFQNTALDYDDLVQEGILGLMKAVERYDPKRGTRFGTLAYWWIRQSMGRAVANQGRVIRLPVNRGWKVSQLYRLTAQLTQPSGDRPNLEAMAHAAGVSTSVVTALLRDGQPVISLDTPRDVNDERDSLESVADPTAPDPEAAAVKNNLYRILEEALASLEAREAQILRMRLGLGGTTVCSLRRIANELKMSPEGVRQVSERATDHLRRMPQVQALTGYLENL